MSVYTAPLYYEIAFGFVDIPKQIDLFEKFINEYSQQPVKAVLDLGCGPSLQLREMAKRGYTAIGLDKSQEMLTYLQEKAEQDGIKIETINQDLCNFTLDKKVDFAMILMGTITYAKNNHLFLQHLNSVAAALNPGGLYLIENFKLDWASPDFYLVQNWPMEKNGIHVRTTFYIQLKDTLTQMLTETLRLDVNDHGKEKSFETIEDTKLIFPQELLLLLELNGKFEFLGWFERDSTQKLSEACNDNIIVLRRK
jgi:SAM-dependent methyltransferase